MFDIYIKDFNKNGKIISTETLIQSVPALLEDDLKFLNPIVKNEFGAAETFDFNIEPGTKFYDAFRQMKTFIRVVYDGINIFYGRVVAIDNNGFRGTRKIRCEGPFAFFLDSPVEGVEEKSRPTITIKEYITKLINNHNSYVSNEANKVFRIGEIPGNYSDAVSNAQRIKNDSKKYGSDSWTDTKSALEDLRSHYGGFFRTRVNGGIGSGIYLDWMDQYFNKNKIKQKVAIGKNILDINTATELENIFTAIVPIGKYTVSSGTSSNTNTGSSKQENLYLDGKILKVPDIVSKYGDSLNFGYHTKEDYQNAVKKYGMIIKTVSFQEANTKEKLYNQACEWIKNNYQGEVLKFTIKAIDMHVIGENTSPIMVGDQVEIEYVVGDENGIFTRKTTVQTCLNISFDLYHPENNSYTFGIPANILTKTYGVTKQANSVNSPSTVPKPVSSGGGSSSVKWIDLVCGWLMRHHVHYTGNKPWKNEYNDNFETGEYLYTPSKHKLVKAIPYRYIIDPANPNHEIPIGNADWYLTNPSAKTKWVLDSLSGTASYGGVVDESLIIEYHVCEWVYQEYGFDLRTQLGVKMPNHLTTDDGEEYTYVEGIDPETGLPIYVLQQFSDGHHTEHYTADGAEIISIRDEDGEWHYYYKDPKTGQIKETNIRDLSIAEENTEDKVGWVVKENKDGTYDLNPETMPGQLRLTIEKGMDGEYVVARVSGEMTYLGNRSTIYNEQVALEHIHDVCGDFEYVEDPVTGLKTIKVNSGGGMRVWHAKIDPETGQPITEDGKIKYAEFGIYDDNTLTGGMITEHLADGSVHTKISGDIVDIDATQVKVGSTSTVSNWLAEQGLSIDDVEGLLADRITAYEGRFSTIETDYLKTKQLHTEINTMTSGVSCKLLAVTESNGYVSAPAFKTSAGGTPYKDFTFNFGDSVSHKVLGQMFNPGPGVSNSYRNIGLKAEELTGSNAGKIRISFYDGFTSEGGDGTGAAVFNIAATKKYKDGVAASWNAARNAMSIPTADANIGQQTDAAMNNLQIKQPKSYSEYNAGSGDGKYVLYNYTMEIGTFTRYQSSTPIKAVLLKSLSTNNVVAALNIDTDWNDQYKSGWNAARNAMSIPTADANISQQSNVAMNNLQIKQPKTYDSFNSSSGDNRYNIFNYQMEVGTFRPTGSTSNVPAILLKSLSTNNVVAALNLSDNLETREETITTGAKTYKPSSGKLGISSIKVTPTHTAPSGSAIGANDILATGISITADGKSATAKMEAGTFKPTGSTSYVGCINLSLGSNTIGRFEVSTATILETREETITTGAKTYKPSSGKLGISSIKVTPTHTAPSGSAIGANDILATGISITADGKSATAKMTKETFRPTGSTSNVRGVKLTLGSTVIGRIDTNSYYTDGVTDGKNSVSLGSRTLTSNNRTYKASEYGYNGFSQVTVDVPSSTISVSRIDLDAWEINYGVPAAVGSDEIETLTILPNYIKQATQTYVWFRSRAISSSGTVLKTKWYRCVCN